MRIFLAASLAALALTTLAAPARAEGNLAFHADASFGYSHFSGADGGLLVGADAFMRWKWLQGGVLLDSTSGTGSETIQGYALGAGLGLYAPKWAKDWGFDAIGVLGAHKYDHVAEGLDTTGASGTLPFVQARIGFNFLKLAPFTLGAWGYVGDDLSRTTKTYTTDSRIIGGVPLTQSVQLGETSWGASLKLGVDLPL